MTYKDLEKTLALIVMLMLILSQATPLLQILVSAQGAQFSLQSYSYKSSANTDTIYPGSRNVILTVNVIYEGSDLIVISAGCINLPQGFSISRGYSSCSAPQMANGSTYATIRQGDVITFTYHIDVANTVNPGSYEASITIYYRDGGTYLSAIVTGISITVSQYPSLEVSVVDWYWSPDAYPGSQGVNLYITLRNVGDATIVQATGSVNLPQDVFFYTQNAIKFQITNLGKNDATTISVGPISIYPEASSTTSYPVTITLDATMSTDDNVIYNAQGETRFYVTISPSPVVNIRIIDYGMETPKPVQGVKQARFYIVVRNMDFKTIRSITAYFRIESSSATFVNASKTSVTVLQQVLNYGDAIAIYSDPLVVQDVNYIKMSVELVIFGDINGAEFWSDQMYTFTVSLAKPVLNIEVVSVFWSPSEVYPGTERATLNIVLLNNDVADFRDCTASATLPPGFYPQQLTVSGIDIGRGSSVQIQFTGISIDSSVLPGEYPLNLTLTGVIYDPSSNSFSKVSMSLTASLKIFRKPSTNVLALISYGWAGDRVYTTTVGTAIYLYFQIAMPGCTVSNPRVTLYLPSQMVFESGNRSKTVIISGDYGYGQYVTVEVGGIDIVTANPGLYSAIVKVEGLARAPGSYWFTQYFTALLRIDEPLLNVSVIDVGWVSNPVSSNASGAGIYVTLQSFSIDSIESTVVRARLSGAKFLSGLNEAVQIIATPINYGEIQSTRFSDVEVSSKTIHIMLTISAILTVGRGAYYKAVKEFNLTLPTVESLNTFGIGSLHTLFRGAYAPLLPSARDVVISTELINIKSVQIAWIKATAAPPPELRVNDIGGNCINGVAAGGTCRIDLNVDVAPEAVPKVVEIVLNLTYATRSGSTISIFTESRRIAVPIADYKYYRPSIAISSAYWGAQTPVRALVGQRNIGFTVTVTNLGYYPIEAVTIKVSPINNSVVMIKDAGECSPQLASGAFCSATLYADLGSVARGGIVVFNITIDYLFTQFGTSVRDSQKFVIALPVEEPASGKGLELIDVSWGNSWPTYPNTENATLVITLANRWAYRVSGIDLKLILPPGFYTKWGGEARAYVQGPINSLQQFSAQLQISTGNIKPGRYTAELVARYIVESGTPNTLVEERHNITLIVHDLSQSVELINVYWIGKAPEPPEYGALLAVVMRNNYNPSIRGVVMEVRLPQGIVAADTNTSTIKVPATSTNILQQLQTARVTPTQLAQLLTSMLASQAQGQQTFGYGDIMYFYLKLNIVADKVGVFKANATLSFIDHWNNVRRVPVEFNITILGSVKIIDVIAPTSITVKRGVANVSIGLVNIGSAPLYNVYIYLVPYVAMLIPQQAVRYINVVKPHEVVNVSYTLVYNPFAVSMGATQTFLRYMSAPFSLSVVYRDVNGNLQVFNTSLAFLLEPFIELVLVDSKAVIEGSTATVSGTVANYGIATARSVVVRAIYGSASGETLIGDLDPASQSSFRIEFRISNKTGDTMMLQLIYRDEYGRADTVNLTVAVVRRQIETTTTPQQAAGIHYNHAAVIALVSIFLIAIAVSLYRYIKAHAKAVEKAIAEAAQR
jgi:hypothetical protein